MRRTGVCSMCPSLSRMGLVVACRRFLLRQIGDGVGGRRPCVALLADLPRLRFAALQAHIAARVGRAAETDLVPRPGMRIVGAAAIGDQKLPEASDVHARPGSFCGKWLFVMNRLEDLFLLKGCEIGE